MKMLKISSKFERQPYLSEGTSHKEITIKINIEKTHKRSVLQEESEKARKSL